MTGVLFRPPATFWSVYRLRPCLAEIVFAAFRKLEYRPAVLCSSWFLLRAFSVAYNLGSNFLLSTYVARCRHEINPPHALPSLSILRTSGNPSKFSSFILRMEISAPFMFISTVSRKSVPINNERCIIVFGTTCIVIPYDTPSITIFVENFPSVKFLLDPILWNSTMSRFNFGAPILIYWSVRIKVNSLPVSISALNSKFPIPTLLHRARSNFRAL